MDVFRQATPFPHLFQGARGVYSAHFAVLLVQFNDWSRRLLVSLDSAPKKKPGY